MGWIASSLPIVGPAAAISLNSSAPAAKTRRKYHRKPVDIVIARLLSIEEPCRDSFFAAGFAAHRLLQTGPDREMPRYTMRSP